MDSCFVLNFGYDAPLPWPQVNCQAQVRKVLIVKVAQNDSLDSSSQKIDQVDIEIKDVG